MIKKDRIYATDNEIFELLKSNQLKLTEKVLREFALDRGIIYSKDDNRDSIIENLSLLQYDYNDLSKLISKSEAPHRAEKLTTIYLNEDLSIPELQHYIDEYQKDNIGEKVLRHKNGANSINATINYTEYDYSKTYLIQRKKRESRITITKESGRLKLTAPANEKSKFFIESIKKKIEDKKQKQLNINLIDLKQIFQEKLLTSFFTRLIKSDTDFILENVTNIRISNIKEINKEEISFEEEETYSEEKEQFAGVVKDIIMKGENLVSSKEYKDLTKKGFLITSITWRAIQNKSQNRVLFTAEYDDDNVLSNFIFLPKGYHEIKNGTYLKSIKAFNHDEKMKLCSQIEIKAISIIESLLKSIDKE